MAYPQVILPQADAACGKVFFPDRRTADGHRIALEVWNRATGRGREGYRLAVYPLQAMRGIPHRSEAHRPQSDPCLPRAGSHGKVRFVARDGESRRKREVITSRAAWF